MKSSRPAPGEVIHTATGTGLGGSMTFMLPFRLRICDDRESRQAAAAIINGIRRSRRGAIGETKAVGQCSR
jgi:hypothetical protein